MESFKSLSELGIDQNVLDNYQILCLPQNIDDYARDSFLIDSGESITLSKLLKEQGVKCANSYDLQLQTKISENRGLDIWLGTIFILHDGVLPVLTSVVGRLIGEKVQNKLERSKKRTSPQEMKETEETKVHANLKYVGGKLSEFDIKYSGNVEDFLQILHNLNGGKIPDEN